MVCPFLPILDFRCGMYDLVVMFDYGLGFLK